jgi:hypothetical protein
MNGLAQERAADADRSPVAIVPVLYSMSASDLKNPLSSFPLYPGEDRAKVSEICVRLAKEAGVPAPRPEFWGPALDKYMSAVTAHRPRRPRTSDDMALWRARIEPLVQTGRANEVLGLRQQMYEVFGPDFEPVSIALHDLLSSVMLETGNFAEAIEEGDFGLRLDNRDVTLLHRKALALAEQNELQSALNAVNRVIDSSPALAAGLG